MSDDALLLPDYAMQRKVRRIAASPEAMLAAAQRVVEQHSDACYCGLEDSVAALEALCAEPAGDGNLAAVAREIRDYASLLGLAHVASVAAAIPRLLFDKTAARSTATIVRLHVDAVRLLVRNRLGEGEAPARSLLEGLADSRRTLERRSA